MATPPSFIGVDLGGTRTTVARFDAQMHCTARDTFLTNAARGFSAVREDLLQHIAQLYTSDTVGIGIGVPGFVDIKTKCIVKLPNIPGAENHDLAAAVRSRFHVPTAIDNDARCFALAEARDGAGKGHRVVLGVTLGTGVGGGIVIDGELFHGARGFAGEVGHMLLKPGEPPYVTDDHRGDVEQFLSGTALKRRCPAAQNPGEYLAGETCGFLHPQVVREFAWLLVNLTHCLDPSIIVLGGGAGRALRPYLGAIAAELPLWLLPGVPPPALAIGTLPDAAVQGAAMLASTLPPAAAF